MEAVIAAFASGSSWIWLALGAILITLEILTPSTYFLWPGIAAIVVGLLAALLGPFDWRLQILVFGVLAVASSVAWRAYLARRGESPSEEPLLNLRARQYVGRRVVVAAGFVNGQGQVKLDDTLWQAATLDGSNPAPGAAVDVVEVAGTVLRVRPAS